MTTLTSFLANGSEGLRTFRLREHIDWRLCEKKKKKGCKRWNLRYIYWRWQGQLARCSTLNSVFMEMWHIPVSMDGTQSKTFFFFFFIHKHWLSISKHNWISQKSQSGWEGTASPCSAPSEAGRQQTHRAVWSPWNVPVLLSLTPLCSVLSADSWHGTRHARHNPPTWNRIEEQNSI